MRPTAEELNAFLHEAFPASHDDGFRCERVGEGSALIRWPFDEARLRPGGYIPGPVQFAIADLALWFATFTVIGIHPMALTTDLAITFMRPAAGGDLLAKATLRRVGRHRIYGDIDIWVDGHRDSPSAHASGHYTNPTGKKPPRP